MNPRQKILARIDRLETERCANCNKSSYSSSQITCKCDAAMEIRELGQQLINLTAKKRQVFIDAKVEELRKTGITVEGYRELREMELTNKQIVKALGIKEADFYLWKNSGSSDMPAATVKGKKFNSPESQERRKWQSIAAQNGIKYKTFMGRVSNGQSFEEAARKPVVDNSLKNEYSVEDSWKASLNGISKEAYRARVRGGWPSKYACQVPIGTQLKIWLREQEGVRA